MIIGSLGSLSTLIRWHLASVHAVDITAEKLRLTGCPHGDLEVQPTAFEGERLYPREAGPARWDAAAFFLLIVMTVIACGRLSGGHGQNPFVLVALSALVAAPVFVAFPLAVKRWYGYPVLLIPFIFASLALAFFEIAK